MATMILHCSLFLSRRRPPSVFRRFGVLPCEFEVLGSSVLSIQDAQRRLSMKLNGFRMGSCIPPILLNASDISKCEAVCDDHLAIDIQRPTVNQEYLAVCSPATVLLLTNALMLSVPFEALAETCEADNSFYNMPLLLFIALVGAIVGGLVARQRKGELQKVNEQLRQINAALRRQAKIESYAPTLSYAPVGARIPESEVLVDPRRAELISHLKAGKNHLRNQNPENAFVEFKAGLDIAQQLKDPIEEKKAARGLGASLQRQGKYRDAIKYHSMVLEISKKEGEDSGNTEAYGAIADCYTELGDLERAGKFYDEYIARLEQD